MCVWLLPRKLEPDWRTKIITTMRHKIHRQVQQCQHHGAIERRVATLTEKEKNHYAAHYLSTPDKHKNMV